MRIDPLPPLYEEPAKTGWRLPVLVAAVLGLLMLAAIFWLGRPASQTTVPPAPVHLPPLDQEGRAYAEKIEIAGLALSRWQNFLGQEVTYLDATLTNHGDRTLRAVELTIEFRDVLNQVVLRETLRPVGSAPTAQSTPPLPPGQTRDFRASFDSLPKDWNHFPPTVRVSALLLH
ncbi:MAG: DUF3426 domain-containing protein [Acidobacteria bacterium]|nr:DUF3426 domain-containing protein [Acidobacteriota bacterium]